MQGLYAELDRAKLDNDLLRGVSFECADATECEAFRHTHIYLFDRVFSHYTLEAIAKVGATPNAPSPPHTRDFAPLCSATRLGAVRHLVRGHGTRLATRTLRLAPPFVHHGRQVLQRSPFYVMISSKAPPVWWGVGLSKVQPVAKVRFVTTGRERCTAYIYINAHFIPGLGSAL